MIGVADPSIGAQLVAAGAPLVGVVVGAAAAIGWGEFRWWRQNRRRDAHSRRFVK